MEAHPVKGDHPDADADADVDDDVALSSAANRRTAEEQMYQMVL